MQQAIRDLHPMPGPAVYRREGGDVYPKLNQGFHVKVRLDGSAWVGDGSVEKINPDELVEVVQDGKS